MRRILSVALIALAYCLPAAAASGDAEAGKKKAEPCAACHGANGVSVSPEFPNLAGQYPDYLAKALTHYKNGKRKHVIMTEQAKALKSDKDILDVAAYFAAQPGLEVKH